jgi:hypothetical protein
VINLTKYFDELSKNYDNKHWWRNVVLISNILGPISSLKYESGDNYLNKDWDNLIIFDACRADMFEEEFNVDEFDDYEVRQSPGSSSIEWMRECFGDDKWNDIVYVSGNPWISKAGSDAFHKSINLWTLDHNLEQKNIQNPLDKNELGTIRADRLTEVALEKFEQYPNKRFIIHYLQPHPPCIGKRSGKIREDLDTDYSPNYPESNHTFSEVWEAYKENLRYAYHHSQDFVETAKGKTVYTADHGELFGERIWPIQMKLYGHPQKIYHPKLVNVPWATETIGERREIKEGEISKHNYSDEEINKRLEDLGYKL